MEQKNKNWFRRHWIITTILVLFILGIIGAVFSDNSMNTNYNTNSEDNEQPAVGQQLAQGVDEPPASTETIYSINQNIPVDYLTYQVTKAETFTKMGTTYLSKETEGKFVKVYLKITNNAKETEEIFTPRFKIEDNQGRRYERLSDDSFYISDGLEFGKQLQPGLATSGAIVFEMPKNSQELKLIISGDWLSDSEAKVLLSDIKNIGTDTTLKKEQDEMMDEAMNTCNAPFECTSSCPDYMDAGQKDCGSGQLCCMNQD